MVLGIVGRYTRTTDDAQFLISRLNLQFPLIVQLTAAIALGVLLGPQLPERALNLLVEYTEEDLNVVSSHTKALNWGESMLGHVWQILHSLGL